jgi:hypothetical protein
MRREADLKAFLWVPVLILVVACQAVSPTDELPSSHEAAAPPGIATTTPGSSSSEPQATVSGPMLGGCPLFPADNFWNVPVDALPVDPHSEAWIRSIGRDEGLHMDFGSGAWDGGPIGIPYNIVRGNSVKKLTLDFYYPDESDPGPYPIPPDPAVEYGGDAHILIVDSDLCRLYEIYDASYENGQWSGGSGAVWDLNSNALRPAGWTSADAAGLPRCRTWV